MVEQKGPNESEAEIESGSGDSKATLFGRQLPFESETNFYILANTLDVFMTFVLLKTGGFRESNEVANRVLDMFGIRGLVFFKFAIVAFVCVLAQMIAVKQPQTAKKLLIGGTVVVFAVVLYSCFLFLKYSKIMA